MVKIGIIGAGRIGKVHCENIRRVKNAEVAAIADPRLADEAKGRAEFLGIKGIYGDYRRILDDDGIDAVLICSPTDTHSRICLEAISARKHVFCEKPIDFDVDKIKKVAAASKESGLIFQVGFNRRFDHNFRAVRNAVSQGKIGDLVLLKICSRDPGAPPVGYIKSSGGMFLDMTIHDFDMARFVSGSEVEEVFARGAVFVDENIGKAGDIDTAVISMKLANGALAVIDNCREASYGYDQRIEVFGRLGQVAVGNDTASAAVISDKDGIHGEKPLNFFLERYAESYAAEIAAFADCVEKDVPSLVGIDAGLKAVLIAIAAKRSLNLNKPVKIADVERALDV